MQKIKLKTEESGKKLLEAYAPPKWSETADDDGSFSKIFLNVLAMHGDIMLKNNESHNMSSFKLIDQF